MRVNPHWSLGLFCGVWRNPRESLSLDHSTGGQAWEYKKGSEQSISPLQVKSLLQEPGTASFASIQHLDKTNTSQVKNEGRFCYTTPSRPAIEALTISLISHSREMQRIICTKSSQSGEACPDQHNCGGISAPVSHEQGWREPLFQLEQNPPGALALLDCPDSNLHLCLAQSWDLFLAGHSLLLPWLIQETQIQESQGSTADPEENKSLLPLGHGLLCWLDVQCSGVFLISVLCLTQNQS